MGDTIRVANEFETGEQWSKDLVARVGRAIKDARNGRSAAWLSDRTADLGYRVSPTVIAKLDSGHRGSVLSVPELIVLAAALDTSPVSLVYPRPYDAMTEILPGVESTSFIAAEWFSAREWFGMATGPGDDPVSRWRAATSALTLYRQLTDLQQQRSRAQMEILGADIAPEMLSVHHSRLKLLDDSIADIRLRLGIDGGDSNA